MDVSDDLRIPFISNELFQNVMEQYLVVYGIALLYNTVSYAQK
jgi:hypothetical protein